MKTSPSRTCIIFFTGGLKYRDKSLCLQLPRSTHHGARSYTAIHSTNMRAKIVSASIESQLRVSWLIV